METMEITVTRVALYNSTRKDWNVIENNPDTGFKCLLSPIKSGMILFKVYDDKNESIISVKETVDNFKVYTRRPDIAVKYFNTGIGWCKVQLTLNDEGFNLIVRSFQDMRIEIVNKGKENVCNENKENEAIELNDLELLEYISMRIQESEFIELVCS